MLDLKSLIPWGQKTNVPVHRSEDKEPFVHFRNEVDRLFDNFFEGFGSFGSNGLMSMRNGSSSMMMPAIDVEDGEKQMVITAEVPGVDEKDLDVTLNDDVLTIHGEKKHDHEEKNGERHYVERHYGSFSRSVRLPFAAGDSDVEAQFDKGVLTITIPKPADYQSKVKRIEVKGS